MRFANVKQSIIANREELQTATSSAHTLFIYPVNTV
jgi:hypothetical protein